MMLLAPKGEKSWKFFHGCHTVMVATHLLSVEILRVLVAVA